MTKGRLPELTKRGFSLNITLEKEFRLWANQTYAVATLIRKIETQRECYIVKLLYSPVFRKKRLN